MTTIIRPQVTCRWLSAAAFLALFSSVLVGEEWVAPANAASVANPVPATPESVSNGKTLYEHNCLACHGATGLGDGATAAYLNPKPSNLALPAVVKQSDGALFWKISTGRGLMVGWTAMIKEDRQRWDLVNYIRTFAPKPAH
jgi:mono/diheme cytochrome c family protein